MPKAVCKHFQEWKDIVDRAKIRDGIPTIYSDGSVSYNVWKLMKVLDDSRFFGYPDKSAIGGNCIYYAMSPALECKCENVEDLKKRIGELEEQLRSSSVDKDSAESMLNNSKEGYNKLWNEYSKNVDDYNTLLENTVKKEAFEKLETEYRKNIKDYNELFGEYKELAERAKNLQEKYNKLVDEYNDKITDYQDMKEKYEDINEKLHNEKLKHANESGNEKLKHLGEKSQLQNQNTRLQEKFESKSAELIKVTRQLEELKEEFKLARIEGEKKIARLENKLDEKSGQLVVLRLESGEKDSKLREKESELARKNEEIERLKRKGGLSQEELLTEKLRSEKGNLELLANELKIGVQSKFIV